MKKTAAAQLDYGALCVDTCIFDSNAIALEKGLLKQLEQFASSPVRFLMPDIVQKELHEHLSRRARDARNKIATAFGSMLA
jgi:hypothetical protein